MCFDQIVDPWGEVLADLETEVGVAVAELDLEKLAKHRLSLPVQNNKRHDIYKTELNSSGICFFHLPPQIWENWLFIVDSILVSVSSPC